MGPSDHRKAKDRKPSSLLGSTIRQHRLDLGLSQQEFADRLGVNQSQVARWETGVTRELSQRARELLADSGMDRTLLGISGLDFDLVRILIEAARDAILLNGKPLLGAQLLSRPARWANLWHPYRTDHEYRMSDSSLETISDANFYFGLAKSLTTVTPASSAVMDSMWRAEFAARQIDDEDSRHMRGSNTLIISGNEFRKVGHYEDALMYLNTAQQWSNRAGLPRREAESLGLLAYAHANSGHVSECRSSLDSAGEKVSEADCGPLDIGESMFSEASLAEISLRCATIVGTRRELRAACANLELPPHADKHWAIYYSNTAGQALLKLRDPDALYWFEYVAREGIKIDAKGQLAKTLLSLNSVKSERADTLRATIVAYLQPEFGPAPSRD